MDAFPATFLDVRLEAVERHLRQPGDAVRGSTLATCSLWIVLEGCLDATVAGKRWEVPAGAVFLLSGNVPYDITTVQRATWLSVQLRATLFGRFDLLASLHPPVLGIPDAQQQRAFQGWAEQLIALRRDGRSGEGAAALIGEGLGRALLGLCWQMLGGGDLAQSTTHLVPKWLPGALERIRREPGIRLEMLSHDLGVSPLRLRRGFHKYLGISPQAYLTHARLQEARCLLAMTDLSVTAVAERVGFESQPHFSSLFKRTYGQAPTQYRQSAASLPAGLPSGSSLPRSP